MTKLDRAKADLNNHRGECPRWDFEDNGGCEDCEFYETEFVWYLQQPEDGGPVVKPGVRLNS